MSAAAYLKDKAQQTRTLQNLPKDVHRLILLNLADSTPSAVLSLSQSSKILHDVSMPFIYRSLVLSKGPKNSKKLSTYETLVNKFRDPASDIAKHVRCITIESELPREDLLLIIERIAEGGRLARLEWNTYAHMPSDIFERIHLTWPNLDLSVTIKDRPSVDTAAHRQMDIALLSSPLLTELTYTVYYKGWQAGTPVCSEWPKLTQALLAGGNIRSLRITSQPDVYPSIVDDIEPEKIPRLDLQPGIRLPKLEELSIKAETHRYLWDEHHCLALRDAINLARIQVLDFGSDNPEEFFSTFTGLLPNLRSLGFGVKQGSVKPARNFIKSVTGLESLRVMSVKDEISDLWPAINCHKETLKSLVFGLRLYSGPDYYAHGTPEYMSMRSLNSILNKFPKLEHLGWPVPCEQSIDEKHLSIFPTLNLKTLEIFTHLPEKPSDYAGTRISGGLGIQNLPPLDGKKSTAAATRIAMAISQTQNKPLERLTMHFSRSATADRGDPYVMYADFQLRRNERFDAGGEVRYCVSEWDDFHYRN